MASKCQTGSKRRAASTGADDDVLVRLVCWRIGLQLRPVRWEVILLRKARNSNVYVSTVKVRLYHRYRASSRRTSVLPWRLLH